jgi:hypothetical protein
VRGGRAAAAALLVSLAAACASSGGTDATPSAPTPSVSPTVLPHRGGLVGAVDAARLLAVCENVRLAGTALDGGLSAGAVASALDAALDALRQPPTSDGLRAAAAHWSAVRQRTGDARTVRRLQAFCEREGG